MPYTYSVPAAGSAMTAAAVHGLLKKPNIIAMRVADIADQRFISDKVLAQRFIAQGGGILYETGGSQFTEHDPEPVAEGANYPQATAAAGDLVAAEVRKFGLEVPVTDEAIARLQINVVDRVLSKVVATTVRHVDRISLAVINAKVTQSYDCTSTSWDDGNNIVRSVLSAKAQMAAHGEGIDPDIVVLSDQAYAVVMSELVASGVLPRDGKDNPIMSGTWPSLFGLTWVATPYAVSTDPFLADSTVLGGMADENLHSPGYARTKSGAALETLVRREDDWDGYHVRARRVTVPVVTEPLAGLHLRNTGLPTA